MRDSNIFTQRKCVRVSAPMWSCIPGRKISDVFRYEFTSVAVHPDLLNALLEYLTVLLEYLDLFEFQWRSTANVWKGLGTARPPLATPLLLLLCVYYLVYIS